MCNNYLIYLAKHSSMDIKIDHTNLVITKKNIQKMLFIMNGLENGWTISKKGEKYIFCRKNNGEKEIFDDKYLSTFIEENTNLEKIKMDFM